MNQIVYHSKTQDGEILARVLDGTARVYYRPIGKNHFDRVIRETNGTMTSIYKLSQGAYKFLSHAFRLCKDKINGKKSSNP